MLIKPFASGILKHKHRSIQLSADRTLALINSGKIQTSIPVNIVEIYKGDSVMMDVQPRKNGRARQNIRGSYKLNSIEIV